MTPVHIALPGHINIWLASIDSSADQSRRGRERATIAAMVSHILGPGAAISHRPDGSPFISGADICVSVSHSTHLAALLLSPSPAGVDIEESRPAQLCRVAPRVLTPDELRYYSNTENGLLRAWTLKEAAFKAAGQPLADLRLISIPTDADTRICRLEKIKMSIACSHELQVGGIQAWISVVVRQSLVP